MTEASLTKADRYEPTAAELKILDVLIEPENRLKNVTEICKLARVSRETYYMAMKKPEFVSLLPDMALQAIKGRILQVINAVFDAAMNGSVADRKMLLEMSGLLATQGTGQNNTVNNTQNNFIVQIESKRIAQVSDENRPS